MPVALDVAPESTGLAFDPLGGRRRPALPPQPRPRSAGPAGLGGAALPGAPGPEEDAEDLSVGLSQLLQQLAAGKKKKETRGPTAF